MSKCIKLRLSLEWMEKNYRIIVINEEKKFRDLIAYIWLLWWFSWEYDDIDCYDNLEWEDLGYDDVRGYDQKIGEYNWEKYKKTVFYYGGVWGIDIEYIWEEECKWDEPKILEWKWGKMIEEFEWVEEIKELIEIYKEKDEEKAKEKWYVDYETLKWEIENVILKEIDWSKYNIKDELKKIKEEEWIDLLKKAKDFGKCFKDEDIR